MNEPVIPPQMPQMPPLTTAGGVLPPMPGVAPAAPAAAPALSALPVMPAMSTMPNMPPGAMLSAVTGDNSLDELIGFSTQLDLREGIGAESVPPPPPDGANMVRATLLCVKEWVPERDPNTGQVIVENGKQKGAQTEFPGRFIRIYTTKEGVSIAIMRIRVSMLNTTGAVCRTEEVEVSTSARRNGAIPMFDLARAVAEAKGELHNFAALTASFRANARTMLLYIKDNMLQQQQALGYVPLSAIIKTRWVPRNMHPTDKELEKLKPREQEYARRYGIPTTPVIYGLEAIKKQSGGDPRPRSLTINGTVMPGNSITELVQWGPAI